MDASAATPAPVTSPRVLIVDDSAAQRALTAVHLRRWGFEIEEADDGTSGLEVMKRTRFDVVLSDWMMPQMDGPALCAASRDLPNSCYTYFILVSSKSEKADIAQGLEAGADDFLTKPFHSDELRARLTAGLRIVEMDQALKTKNEEVSRAYDHLQRVHEAVNRDLKEAGAFQQSLVPKRDQVIDGGRMCFLLESCGHVGGDLVGSYWVSPERLVMYSIDVSGHGISSALLTARIAAQLNSTDLHNHVGYRFDEGGTAHPRKPSEIAAALNARMLEELETEHYFTMALIDLDLAKGEGFFVQAGHPQPVIFTIGGAARLIGEGGPPIGLVDGMTFEDEVFLLQPGEGVLLYSDGIIEAENAEGELFDDDRLLAALSGVKAPVTPELLADLTWAVKTHCQDEPLKDDVSAALLVRNP
ncbi:MAG: SpoIIE family protein phosphatase [Pseudomonadota bacterium]